MLSFDFIVEGAPVSQQARHREKLNAWMATVRAAAEQRWPAENPPIEQPVRVEITHFFVGAPADVDNIPKPILDAMKGVVYKDDKQVSDVVSRRRPLEGPYIVGNVYPALAEGIDLGKEFLHIRITFAAADGELNFYE